ENRTFFSLGESEVFHTRLSYANLAFDLNGKTYILRTAIPVSQVEALTEEFRNWFFIFCAIALLFFGAITWLLFHRINFPVRQIIKAIKPYQSGQQETIPEIVLSKSI